MPQWVHPTPRLPIGQIEFLSTPSGRRRLRIDDQINHLTIIQGLGVLMPPFKVIYSTSIVYVVLCYVMLCFNLYSAFSTCFQVLKGVFFSSSRCDTHHSMFNVMFLESNQETVLACSHYRALPTIFMTGSAGI
jgi:hypothetical protein